MPKMRFLRGSSGSYGFVHAGEVREIPEDIALQLELAGLAERFREPVMERIGKMLSGAPENKMLSGADENKAHHRYGGAFRKSLRRGRQG